MSGPVYSLGNAFVAIWREYETRGFKFPWRSGYTVAANILATCHFRYARAYVHANVQYNGLLPESLRIYGPEVPWFLGPDAYLPFMKSDDVGDVLEQVNTRSFLQMGCIRTASFGVCGMGSILAVLPLRLDETALANGQNEIVRIFEYEGAVVSAHLVRIDNSDLGKVFWKRSNHFMPRSENAVLFVEGYDLERLYSAIPEIQQRIEKSRFYVSGLQDFTFYQLATVQTKADLGDFRPIRASMSDDFHPAVPHFF